VNCTKEEEETGAWAVLAALEKSKESQAVQVARLVSSLEVLLPRTGKFEGAAALNPLNCSASETARNGTDEVDILESTQHIMPSSQDPHTTDPAFYYLPKEIIVNNNIKGDDIRKIFQATLHGKRIDLRTVTALLQAATRHFRSKAAAAASSSSTSLGTAALVSLPPLQEHQQLTVIGDLHGSLSDLAAVLSLMGNVEPSHNNMILFNGDLADR
jgi:hypothetical protein